VRESWWIWHLKWNLSGMGIITDERRWKMLDGDQDWRLTPESRNPFEISSIPAISFKWLKTWETVLWGYWSAVFVKCHSWIVSNHRQICRDWLFVASHLKHFGWIWFSIACLIKSPVLSRSWRLMPFHRFYRFDRSFFSPLLSSSIKDNFEISAA
jgi:hypothetical protein